MDNQIKTSFIPRKPLATGSIGTDVRSAIAPPTKHVGSTIFSLIATIIFIATLAGYGATFVWKNQLLKRVEQQENDMKTALEEFDERFVSSAIRLDTRIQEAKKILENHVAPSALYSLLATYTVESIAFSSFTFEDAKDGAIKIRANGEASRYQSLVLQSDSFKKSGYLRDFLFSGLKKNFETGQIEFTFEATLDPRLILYKEMLTRARN